VISSHYCLLYTSTYLVLIIPPSPLSIHSRVAGQIFPALPFLLGCLIGKLASVIGSCGGLAVAESSI
jgi:hypothetical protein